MNAKGDPSAPSVAASRPDSPRRPLRTGAVGLTLLDGSIRQQHRRDHQQHEGGIAGDPQPALVGKTKPRLQPRRVREQRRDAAEVAGDGREMRIPARPGDRSAQTTAAATDRWSRPRRTSTPTLNTSTRASQRIGVPFGGGSSVAARATGSASGDAAEAGGYGRLPVGRAQPARDRMDVEVTEQQRRLEKHHARVPDRRRAAGQRSTILAIIGCTRKSSVELRNNVQTNSGIMSRLAANRANAMPGRNRMTGANWVRTLTIGSR